MKVLFVLGSLLSAFCLSFLSIDSGWSLPRGNHASTGASEVSLPEKIDVLWEYEIKGLGFDAGPIIAEGTVFAADADGNVIALKLNNGEALWKKKFDASFLASPAFDAGAVYIGDTDGKLHALDATNGNEKWVYDAKREIDAGANFYGDNVLVTSQSGSLFAVSKKDGQLQWQYETGDQLQCGPTLAGKLTFLGGCDQHLHIVDVETGKAVVDKIPIEAPTGSTPCVVGTLALVPTYKGQIWAFETPSNKLAWKFDEPELASEFKNSVASSQGIVVAVSGSRKVLGLDVESGKVLWNKNLKRRTDNSPVIAGNHAIVAGSDGRVYRYELKTGDELPVIELKGGFLGSPAVADGRIVLASDRGTVYCLGAK
ncbi:MAG: PQQ-binding-like beta-propeller repeat protein [Pirellulales bacterium]